jgi:hypothetical protein
MTGNVANHQEKPMRTFILGLAMASSVCFLPPDAETGAAVADKGPSKSIVPGKYSGKYKNGGSDALAEFIKTQCNGKEGFEFPAFFTLCRANGIAEDKVAHYSELVSSKAHGAEGRARMTLRNMLAAIARKNGELVGIDGTTKTAIDLPKPAATGAAKAAQDKAHAAPTDPTTLTADDSDEGEDDGDEDDGDEDDTDN